MTRRTSTFRQIDVSRAVKAAKTAGLIVDGVEVAPDGTIRVIISNTAETKTASPFDLWQAKHARSA